MNDQTQQQEQAAPVDWQAIARQRERELKTVGEQRHAVEQERDGAYRERAHLVAWLAALHPAVIAPAPDVDEDGWQLLYLDASGLQLSWHIAPRDAELFEGVEHVPAEDPRAQWDGHTTDEKYARIRQLAGLGGTETCELPHQTIEEEDECERRPLRAAGDPHDTGLTAVDE